MRRVSAPTIIASVLGAAAFCVGMQAAVADDGTQLILDLLAKNLPGLDKVADQLSTLRMLYQETKRYVGYADDAARSYQALKTYNAEIFGKELGKALDEAFPDVGYYQREASRTGPWAEGTGE